MKFRIDKKYLAWGITVFLTFGACLCLYYLLFYNASLRSGFHRAVGIAMPVIDGFVLAYLMTPIVNGLERRFLNPFSKKHFTANGQLSHKQKSKIRGFSILMTVILAIAVLTGFFRLIIPQIIRSIQSIIFQFPFYIRNLSDMILNLMDSNPELESFATEIIDKYSVQLTTWLNEGLMPQINELLISLSQSIWNFLISIWNFIIGFIISIYVLFNKEKFAGQAKKIAYALFEQKNANQLISDFRFTHKTFIGFIGSKIVDSLIIGIICFIFSSLIHLPYALLVSLIVGVTNVIPFFGPYLGAIPSAILILLVNPIQSLYFLIMIIIIQQFDGNFLGPKILGNSTGLSSFWVIFAVTVFGGFFGIIGMIAGVPIFACIYAWVSRFIRHCLKKKQMPADTKDYLNVERIEEGQFIKTPGKPEGKEAGSPFKRITAMFVKNKSGSEDMEDAVSDEVPEVKNSTEETLK